MGLILLVWFDHIILIPRVDLKIGEDLREQCSLSYLSYPTLSVWGTQSFVWFEVCGFPFLTLTSSFQWFPVSLMLNGLPWPRCRGWWTWVVSRVCLWQPMARWFAKHPNAMVGMWPSVSLIPKSQASRDFSFWNLTSPKDHFLKISLFSW